MQAYTQTDLTRTDLEVMVLFVELLKEIGADMDQIVEEIISKPQPNLDNLIELINQKIEQTTLNWTNLSTKYTSSCNATLPCWAGSFIFPSYQPFNPIF